MVKRYSITLPDDLAEQFEKNKGSMSLSVICRNAVDAAVKERLSVQKRMEQGESMEDFIARMKAEKAELEGVYSKDGKEAGIDWAKKQSYATLKSTAMAMKDASLDELQSDFIEFGGDIADELYEASEGYVREDKIPLYHDNDMDNLTEEGMDWLLGFQDGVLDVWERVEDAL